MRMSIDEHQLSIRQATLEDVEAISTLTNNAYTRYIPVLGRKPQPMTANYTKMVVENSIRRALELQNPDGSFSAQYFRRPSSSPDMAAVLGSSGHMLEFLAVAMTDEQLRHPQGRLAARHLCRLFRDTQDLDLECGALYHAAHGLVLYRERLFGARTYQADGPPQAIAGKG